MQAAKKAARNKMFCKSIDSTKKFCAKLMETLSTFLQLYFLLNIEYLRKAKTPSMKSLRLSHVIILIALIIVVIAAYKLLQPKPGKETPLLVKADSAKTTAPKNDWQPPDTNSIPHTEDGDLIRYGRDLIANTAYYLGPKGSVAHVSNGMNCQNCHIDAGAKPYGNCFSAVASIYPTFRPRSGIVESIEFRVNDCLQRSLNGKTI